MLLLPAAAVLMVFLGTTYVRKKHETGRKEIGYKVSATLMAVLPALYLAIREQNRVSLLIAAGTLCCMAADALLEVQFVTGAAVFAAAHLFFIAGMLCLVSPAVYAGIVCLCVRSTLCHTQAVYQKTWEAGGFGGAVCGVSLCHVFHGGDCVF